MGVAFTDEFAFLDRYKFKIAYVHIVVMLRKVSKVAIGVKTQYTRLLFFSAEAKSYIPCPDMGGIFITAVLFNVKYLPPCAGAA